VRLDRERTIPAFRNALGFRHFSGASDRAGGRGYSATLGDTPGRAEGLREAMGDPIMPGLPNLGVQVENVQILEVTAGA
jgi:hypothetical protein